MMERLEELGEHDYYTYDLGDDVLFINKDGFSLKNKKKGRFTIDASLWAEEKHIRVGDKVFRLVFREVTEAEEVL